MGRVGRILVDVPEHCPLLVIENSNDHPVTTEKLDTLPFLG